MFDEWKKRRKLKKELEEIDRLYAPDFRAAKSENDYHAVRAGYDVETAETISELRRMETAKLVKRAKKYGVESPPHYLVTGQLPYWEKNDHTQRTYLSDNGAAKLNHETSEAVLNYWKRWVEIVSPIATVLIALFALGLSILALYLQLSGAASIPPR
jgi:hypothetical protein